MSVAIYLQDLTSSVKWPAVMSLKGRHHSSRRSTDASRSSAQHHLPGGGTEMEAVGAGMDADGDHIALLLGGGTGGTAVSDGLASSPATATLDASAPIALDISPPLASRRERPSLKRRATVQSSTSSPAAGRPAWKLKYQDFVPPVSASLLTGLASTSAGALCLDCSDPFQ